MNWLCNEDIIKQCMLHCYLVYRALWIKEKRGDRLLIPNASFTAVTASLGNYLLEAAPSLDGEPTQSLATEQLRLNSYTLVLRYCYYLCTF